MYEVKTNRACCGDVELPERKYLHPNATASATITITFTITTVTKAKDNAINYTTATIPDGTITAATKTNDIKGENFGNIEIEWT